MREREQRGAQRAEPQATGMAFEELGVERLFQRLDLTAERRLAAPHTRRGGREGSGLRHGDKDLDQGPVEGGQGIIHSQMNSRPADSGNVPGVGE